MTMTTVEQMRETTWSPGSRSVTFSPTFSTIPAPSWPKTAGSGAIAASRATASV